MRLWPGTRAAAAPGRRSGGCQPQRAGGGAGAREAPPWGEAAAEGAHCPPCSRPGLVDAAVKARCPCGPAPGPGLAAVHHEHPSRGRGGLRWGEGAAEAGAPGVGGGARYSQGLAQLRGGRPGPGRQGLGLGGQGGRVEEPYSPSQRPVPALGGLRPCPPRLDMSPPAPHPGCSAGVSWGGAHGTRTSLRRWRGCGAGSHSVLDTCPGRSA